MRARKLLLTCSVAITLLASSETARAYIIPPSFICRLFSLNRRQMRIDDLSLELDVTVAARRTDEADRVLVGHLYLRQPRQLRLVLSGESDSPAVMIENNGKRRATPDNPDLALLPSIDPLTTFFAFTHNDSEVMSGEMIALLQSLGIDTQEVSLRRWEHDSFIYVIGAKPWDTQAPQAWFLKDAELPLYFRYRAPSLAGGTELWELHLRNWGSSEAGNWFPGELEYLRNGESIMSWRVTRAQRNTSLPDTLFTTLGG